MVPSICWLGADSEELELLRTFFLQIILHTEFTWAKMKAPKDRNSFQGQP
jgi:hypothetical protein